MAYTFSSSGKIEYPTQSAFNGATRLSVSLWVKTISATSYEFFVHQRDDVDPKYGFSVGTDFGGTQMTLRVAPSNYSAANVAGQLTTAWQHFLWVYDGTLAQAERGRLYRQGVDQTITNALLDASSIGATTVPLTLTGNGYMIAEVGLWVGTAITSSSAIANLAAGYAPPDCGQAGLSYYWSLATTTTESVAGLGTGTASGTVTLAGDHPTMISLNVPTLSVRVQESQVGGATF